LPEIDMIDINDLDKVSVAIQKYQAMLGNLPRDAGNADMRKQVETMLASLEKTQAELRVEVEKHNQRMSETVKTVQEKTAGARDQVESAIKEANEKAQAAAAKKAARKEKPQKPVDPQLGKRLRSRLLEEFGNRRPTADAHPEDREIWEDWDT
jgi:hypothetical protein